MRIKQRPEDFVVEEVSRFDPAPDGDVAVYRMVKRERSTLEALETLKRAFGVRASDISVAGLKDKYALTNQLVGVRSPSARPSLDLGPITLEFLGRTAGPISAQAIERNTFRVTARALTPSEAGLLEDNLPGVATHGLVNYFDSQRFRGQEHIGGFIGKAVFRGDFEEALRLHMAVPHKKLPRHRKRILKTIEEHFGAWAHLSRALPACPERALCDYLRKHPGDHAGAFERIPTRLRILYLSAYQARLLNEALDGFVRSAIAPGHRVEMRTCIGAVSTFSAAPPEGWAALDVPIPAPGTDWEAHEAFAPHFAEVFAREGIAPEATDLGLQRTRLRGGLRKLLIVPEGLSASASEPDEINPGLHRVTLRFSLPRGSYGTLVLKRLLAPPPGREPVGVFLDDGDA